MKIWSSLFKIIRNTLNWRHLVLNQIDSTGHMPMKPALVGNQSQSLKAFYCIIYTCTSSSSKVACEPKRRERKREIFLETQRPWGQILKVLRFQVTPFIFFLSYFCPQNFSWKYRFQRAVTTVETKSCFCANLSCPNRIKLVSNTMVGILHI